MLPEAPRRGISVKCTHSWEARDTFFSSPIPPSMAKLVYFAAIFVANRGAIRFAQIDKSTKWVIVAIRHCMAGRDV